MNIGALLGNIGGMVGPAATPKANSETIDRSVLQSLAAMNGIDGSDEPSNSGFRERLMAALEQMSESTISPSDSLNGQDLSGLMSSLDLEPEQLAAMQKSLDNSGVEEVAQKFEGMFTSMLLKELRGSSGEGGLFSGDSSDTYGGMFDMFLSDHLTKNQGGLGIGSMVKAYLSNQGDHSEEVRELLAGQLGT
jgi:Rod binding protein